MNLRGLIILIIVASISLLAGVGGCDKLVTEQISETIVDTTLGQACLSCHNDNANLILRPKAQMENSKHFTSAQLIDAVVTLNTKPRNVSACGPQCHTNEGYIKTFDSLNVNTPGFSAISCNTCHQPHTGSYGQWDIDTLRALADFTVLSNDSVYRMGKSNMCAHCHQAANPAPTGTASVFLSADDFGPHSGAQADVLNGTGGFRFGTITSSGSNHRTAVTQKNGCLSCHFGAGQGYDYGQHTFRLQSDDASTQYVANCNVSGCHSSSPITNFYAFASIDSIRTMADSLRSILTGLGYVKSDSVSFAADSTLSAREAKVLYNYLLYQLDGSEGIHNPEYMQQLLSQSLAQTDSLPPTAGFTTSDTSGCTPYSATFDATASTGTNLTYRWNFGDNDSTTGVTPTHIYDTAGVFTVRLIVSNPGGSDTVTQVGRIIVGTVPVAAITTIDTVVVIGTPITLNGTTFNVLTHDWSITDSLGAPVIDTSTSSATLQITLNNPGLYTVSLTEGNACGTDDTTQVNLIRVTSVLLGKLLNR